MLQTANYKDYYYATVLALSTRSSSSLTLTQLTDLDREAVVIEVLWGMLYTSLTGFCLWMLRFSAAWKVLGPCWDLEGGMGGPNFDDAVTGVT